MDTITDMKNMDTNTDHNVKLRRSQLEEVQSEVGHHALEKECSDFSEYSQNTTCHGVSYIFRPGHGSVRKLIWLVLYLTCFGTYLYFSTTAIIRFLGRPVSTNTEYVYESNMEFPTVTLCSIDYIKESYQMAAEADGSLPATSSLMDFVRQQVYLGKIDLAINEDLSSMQEQDLKAKIDLTKYQELEKAYATAVSSIDYTYHIMKGGYQIDDLMVLHEEGCAQDDSGKWLQCDVKSYVDPLSWGRLCHTITFLDNGTAAKTQQGIQTVAFDVREVQAYNDASLPPMLFLSIQSKDYMSSVWYESKLLEYGKMHSFALERTDVINLPAPYGKCMDTLQDGFENPLTLYDSYNAKTCIHECIALKMNETCGCTWNVHAKKLGARYCLSENDIQCAQDTAWNTHCTHCTEPCYKVLYNFEHDITNPDPRLPITNNMNFFFKNLAYTEIRQTPAYTFDSLFGEVGGQLGLFIGASLLSVGEILDLAFVAAWKKYMSLVCVKPFTNTKVEKNVK